MQNVRSRVHIGERAPSGPTLELITRTQMYEKKVGKKNQKKASAWMYDVRRYEDRAGYDRTEENLVSEVNGEVGDSYHTYEERLRPAMMKHL